MQKVVPCAVVRCNVVVLIALVACHPQPKKPTRGAIAGEVRDRVTGEPVAATLTVHDQESFVVETARAGADGLYAIEGLAPGTYDMVVVLPGSTTLQLTGIPVRAGVTTAFDVPVDVSAVEEEARSFSAIEGDAIETFRPGDLAADRARLLGTVTDSVTLERVAGAVVAATSPALPELMITATDDRGRFRFPDAPPGTYTLSAFYQVARRGQIEVRRSGVEVTAGTAVDVPLFVEVTGTE